MNADCGSYHFGPPYNAFDYCGWCQVFTHNAASRLHNVRPSRKFVRHIAQITLWCEVATHYLIKMMDTAWFKSLQKRSGVTSFDLGEAIGRDRSVISRIVNGSQRMTIEQAGIFAERLGVNLDEMVEKSGLLGPNQAQKLAPGFSESDAVPFIGHESRGESERAREIAAVFGARPGVDVWRVKTSAMALSGLIEGDFMLVDTLAADRARPGDSVIAQVYTPDGTSTVLRRLEPPVLIAASASCNDWRVYVVDGVNVVVRGKVIASWRI